MRIQLKRFFASVISLASLATLGGATFASSAALETLTVPTPTAAQDLAMRVNAYRQTQSLPPLKLNQLLVDAAQSYSDDQAARNFFGHQDPDHSCQRPSGRAMTAGYANWTTVLENLSAGQATSAEAQAAFEGSVHHRVAMESQNVRELGTGFAYDVADANNVRVASDSQCNYSLIDGPFYYYWSEIYGARTLDDTGTPLLPIVISGEQISTTARSVPVYVYGSAPAAADRGAQTVWATQMRFIENGCITAWEPWSANVNYVLSSSTGLKSLAVEITDGTTYQINSDQIWLEDPGSGATRRACALSLTNRTFVPLMAR